MNKIKVIEPPKYFSLNLKELGDYKYLLWNLALRDFKVRYVQTALGGIWAVLNPLITSLFLVFIFGKLAVVSTDGYPILPFCMAGMIVWTFVSAMISEGGNSLLSNQQLISKVYFPRLLLPISKLLIGIIDTSINILLFIVVCFFYKPAISLHLIAIPVVLIILFLTGLSISIFVSVLMLRYKDFHYIVPIILRLGFFVCPISYPSSIVPQQYQFYYFLNPLAGLMELVRWCIFENYRFDNNIYVSLIIALVLSFFALGFYSRIESKIVDYL